MPDLLKEYSESNLLHKGLTEKIIRCFYDVYNDLGYGFLEKVYKNALYYVLIDEGLSCEVECPIKVYHRGRLVGNYRCDLLVDDKVIIEVKTCYELDEAHVLQLMNYLKATSIEVGLVLNFGVTPQFKRRLFTNDKKNIQKIRAYPSNPPNQCIPQ